MSMERDIIFFQPAGDGDRYGLINAMSSAGWDVHIAENKNRAVDLIRSHDIHVGLTRLEGLHDLEKGEIMNLWPLSGHTEWVALLPSEVLDSNAFRRVISECFYDYHTLPPDIDRLLFSLGHAYGMATMARTITEQDGTFGDYEMVGSSPIMQQLFNNIRKVASVDAPVLITGESGTGKELAALAVHERSKRKEGPFVAVNCGALPANLIQSELFGYEKGAFTGAQQRKIGHIEAAAGGTIFLDEIGDLSPELQINLLRFLQEQTISRVGATGPTSVDVRVIAATHVDLEKAVREGRFREDLYYRLHVLNLKVPPLRERDGDIELLARFFFKKFAKEGQPNVKGLGQKALQAMTCYDWPGNVRELINRMRRAVIMSENRIITAEDLGLHEVSLGTSIITLDKARNDAERAAIMRSLQRSSQNISRTARELGVSRVTLYRLMEKHGIET